MCMNDGKTESSNFKSAATLVDGSVIRVGVFTITASRCVRNLGVFFDRHLDMKKQMSQTVSACSFYLRHINQISRFLSKPTKERVFNANITSRLDYCNAILYGRSVVNIACLQRIHSSAAKLILRRPRSDSARPLLQERHWLPVACRVDLKIRVLTYKVMHDEAPVYLCELVRPYQPARALRSANSNSLEVKRTRTKAGGGSFAVAAASLWNTLPNFIKTCDTLASFKCRLKTHFFRIRF